MDNTGFTILNNNILDYNLSGGEFKLYFVLNTYCYGEKDTCFPSEKTLADRLQKSVRTVQRYLKELTTEGLIKIKRRGSISNLYTVITKTGKQIVKSIKEKVNSKNGKDQKNNYYKSNKGNFNNYTTREYDFNVLEAKLTEWMED